MPSINYDIEIDEARDNTFEFAWFAYTGGAADLDGAGAIAEIKTISGTSVSRVTHSDLIEIILPNIIKVTFPNTDLEELEESKYKWELVVFPQASDPTLNPMSLMKGFVKPKKSVADL